MAIDTSKAQATMARIGSELKAARDKKAVTIDQVQKQTRIHSAVIKALEDGRCDEMLTPTYVRSFLRKYAEYLGLDHRQLVNEYANLRREGHSSLGSVMSKMEPSSHVRVSRLLPVLARAAAVALAVLLIAIVIGKSATFIKGWRQSHPARKNKPAAEARTNDASGRNKAVPVRQPSMAPIPKGVPLKLTMKIDRPVRVKVISDGVLLFDTVLERGTIKTLTAEKSFNIYTAKGEAMELVLNGNNLGSPGRGPLKNVEVTRSGFKIK